MVLNTARGRQRAQFLHDNESVLQLWPQSGFSLKIGVAGEYCKVTGGLLWKSKALSGNKQNLVGEFCVVAGELSDPRCPMNTLLSC